MDFKKGVSCYYAEAEEIIVEILQHIFFLYSNNIIKTLFFVYFD